jgi:hypothetical protein
MYDVFTFYTRISDKNYILNDREHACLSDFCNVKRVLRMNKQFDEQFTRKVGIFRFNQKCSSFVLMKTAKP